MSEGNALHVKNCRKLSHAIKKNKKALHSRANLGILIIKQYDLQKARKANAHQTYKSNV